MKILRILGGLIFVLALTAPNIKPAKADGGIFYPDDYLAYETNQRAFIYFAGGIETMVVSAKFSGNAKDFSWVIPLPSQPEISASSSQLFNSLAKITRVSQNSPNVGSAGFGLSGATKSSSVEVISEKTVDAYDTAVLKASDEGALALWLKNHGYSYPAGQETALKSYVDGGWYFAIAKIRPDAVGDQSTSNALSVGMLTPLKFSFKTDKIIYPMKITGIALRAAKATASGGTPMPDGAQPEIVSENIPVTLYVVSESKVEQSLLKVDWANWLGSSDINTINSSIGGEKISGDKLFLTRMSATLSPDDITDDFTILPAVNNLVFPTPVDKTGGFWWGNLLFFALAIFFFIWFPPIGLIFAAFVVLQVFVKKKWLYLLGSIYQILVCLVPIAAGILVFATNSGGLKALLLSNGFIGALVAATAIEIVAIIATIKMFGRYKKIFNAESAR